MRRRPQRGTKPASRTAERRSRTRRVSVRMALISLICVIPTAINWSGLLVRRADFSTKTDAGRPFRDGPHHFGRDLALGVGFEGRQFCPIEPFESHAKG